MISVSITKTGDAYSGFTCSGHAGYAEEGLDIICAAVSALTINTVNSLEQLTDDGLTAEQSEDGGYMKVEVECPLSTEAKVLMQSLVLGLTMIEQTYGNRFLKVQINTKE